MGQNREEIEMSVTQAYMPVLLLQMSPLIHQTSENPHRQECLCHSGDQRR